MRIASGATGIISSVKSWVLLLQAPDRTRGFKKEWILRRLLNHPEREVTKCQIAQEADASDLWVLKYTERLK